MLLMKHAFTMGKEAGKPQLNVRLIYFLSGLEIHHGPSQKVFSSHTNLWFLLSSKTLSASYEMLLAICLIAFSFSLSFSLSSAESGASVGLRLKESF